MSDEKLRQYFPFAVVKRGMFGLAGKLYGISVVEIPGGQHLARHGSLLRDSRSRRRASSAVSTRISSRATASAAARGWTNASCARIWTATAIRRSATWSAISRRRTTDGVSLLTHNDVVTLFHEFGHMLHHLLTRVRLSRASPVSTACRGMRSSYRASSWRISPGRYEVLEESSAHCETGEPLPREIFDKLDASRHFGQGAVNAAADRVCAFRLSTACRTTIRNAAAGCWRRSAPCATKCAVIRHPAYNRLPHSFSHIFAAATPRAITATSGPRCWLPTRLRAFEEAGIFDADTASPVSAGDSRRSAAAATSWRPTSRFAGANRRSTRCSVTAASAKPHENRDLERQFPQRATAACTRVAGSSASPDVLVLQEIKQMTEAFPAEDFRRSRLPRDGQRPEDVQRRRDHSVAAQSTDPSPTFRASTTRNGACLRRRSTAYGVVNLYVPNGSEVGSEKYDLQAGLAEGTEGLPREGTRRLSTSWSSSVTSTSRRMIATSTTPRSGATQSSAARRSGPRSGTASISASPTSFGSSISLKRPSAGGTTGPRASVATPACGST